MPASSAAPASADSIAGMIGSVFERSSNPIATTMPLPAVSQAANSSSSGEKVIPRATKGTAITTMIAVTRHALLLDDPDDSASAANERPSNPAVSGNVQPA